MGRIDMPEMQNVYDELNSVKYGSFSSITAKMNELASKYSDMPMPNLVSAFGRVGFSGLYGSGNLADPQIQNRRVKSISSLPYSYSKQEVEKMIANPNESEKPLRQMYHELEYSCYPLSHTRIVYQNLLTYHSYIAPYLTEKGDAKKADFWREWKLLEKLRTELDIKSVSHEITGQTLQEGKVFYYPRISVDKAHNKVNYAFMQQLPSDYTKIVGFNNKSKYTIAFNMMYFTKCATDIRQFGDLFDEYIDDFNGSVYPSPKRSGSKTLYASATKINLKNVVKNNANVEAYSQNGTWFYWVTLPVDKVFTFELDDTNRNAITPFTGLMISALQLSQLEAIQLELLQNPLVAVLTGEIPYFESKDTNTADQYKLSNAGLSMFEAYWYEMTNGIGNSGIGIYAAPFKNMKLETMPESSEATAIVAIGYQDLINKAGLGGIIPASSDTRSGTAHISLQIESQFCKTIYSCIERMMNTIIGTLNLKYDFRFHMFGDIQSDETTKEDCRKEMALGILPSAITYNAIYDRSILEDISWSDAVNESGLLDLRLPLITSYTASPDSTGLPPQSGKSPDDSEPGRPESEDITSDGKEGDVDSPVTRM